MSITVTMQDNNNKKPLTSKQGQRNQIRGV